MPFLYSSYTFPMLLLYQSYGLPKVHFTLFWLVVLVASFVSGFWLLAFGHSLMVTHSCTCFWLIVSGCSFLFTCFRLLVSGFFFGYSFVANQAATQTNSGSCGPGDRFSLCPVLEQLVGHGSQFDLKPGFPYSPEVPLARS